MIEKDQVINVSLLPQSLKEVEKFVDDFCDKLLINESYYGNILMGVTETFSLCLISEKKTAIKISYSTDYQVVTVYFQRVDKKVSSILKSNPDINKTEGNENAQKSFLINSLTEKIGYKKNGDFGLVFDISAIHSEVVKFRQKNLDNYFEQTLTKSIRKKNDKL